MTLFCGFLFNTIDQFYQIPFQRTSHMSHLPVLQQTAPLPLGVSLNPKVPLNTHKHTVLPPLAKPGQSGDHISGEEIEACSSATLLFLIQNHILMVGGGILCILSNCIAKRERALHGCYILLSCFFLSCVGKRAPLSTLTQRGKSARVAALPGFKSLCGSSSITPFPTSPTLGYTCQ